MKLEEFDFDLPRDLIAQRPVSPRDAARLLHVAGGALEDRRVLDLPGLLRPGDLMVFNDTKVIPARLFGRRGLGRVEVTLHQPEGAGRWRAFARPGKRLKPGDRLDFAAASGKNDGVPSDNAAPRDNATTGANFSAEIVEKLAGGEILLRFDRAEEALSQALQQHGVMPLPPYIRREGGADARDRTDYQTVYAAHEGAVAAPTAGLHFTQALFDALDARGIARANVTLHVGAGTFLPVKTKRVEDHAMHGETGEITAETAARIDAARAAGGRVVAVGTTSLRLLESAARPDGTVEPFAGETRLFILPGHRFRIVDLLMTNFHLPRSTLYMLVSAFAGREAMGAAYAHAVAQGYRFYSYGDSSLLERA